MDKFEKATSAYFLLVLTFGALRALNPAAIIGVIIVHLGYLKFVTEDISEKNASGLWKPAFVLTGIIAAIPYLIQRE